MASGSELIAGQNPLKLLVTQLIVDCIIALEKYCLPRLNSFRRRATMNIQALLRPGTIRRKLTLTFFAFGVLGSICAGLSMSLEMWSADEAAMTEAENVADSIARSGGNALFNDQPALQERLKVIHQTFHREVFIVDPQKRIIADSANADIGEVFQHDPESDPEYAVSKTLIDGKTRKFLKRKINSKTPINLLVVDIRKDGMDDNSPIVGAMVIEYTGVRDQLMAKALAANKLISILILVFLVATFFLARALGLSILVPVRNLRLAVNDFAAGNRSARVEVTSADEIGGLTLAFNRMADALNASDTRMQENDRTLAATALQLAEMNEQLQQEIEEHKRSNEQVEYLAYYDSLTGLPNRTMFSTILTRDLNQAERHDKQLGLLFIDLDQFKHVNDTIGHKTGDELLGEVAQRLKACLRKSDSCARLGGDEFVVLITEIEQDHQLESIARKINAALAQPFPLVGYEFFVTASIGICVYPEDGRDVSSLLKNAEIAMYHAKDEGKNNFQFYSEKMNRNSLLRFALEASLRTALGNNEFSLAYQAKVATRDNHIKGVEALLRWTHPELGPIGPAEFIPLAEATGLIVPIGRWVLHTACVQHAKWCEQGFPDLVMSVNLSARQLSDRSLLDDIAAVLDETGMNPALLELEITESIVIQDMEKALIKLNAIKALGVRLAMDDFGTGYSSLSIIKQLPLDTIKIDRAFIRDMPSDIDANAITTAIIAMCSALGLSVVAEGVETREQVDFLKGLACDEIQGFYFSKPVNADAFYALLASHAFEEVAA